MQVYQQGNTYFGVSTKSPRGFEKVLYLTLTGTDPSNVEETALSVDQIKELNKVENVPVEWQEAFGCAPRKRKTRVETQVETQIEVIEDFRRIDQLAGLVGALATICIVLASFILGALLTYL